MGILIEAIVACRGECPFQGYLIPYTADGRKVVKVGVAFDKKKRNIGRWLVGA